MSDHVHILVSIPLELVVSSFIEYLKGKSCSRCSISQRQGIREFLSRTPDAKENLCVICGDVMA